MNKDLKVLSFVVSAVAIICVFISTFNLNTRIEKLDNRINDVETDLYNAKQHMGKFVVQELTGTCRVRSNGFEREFVKLKVDKDFTSGLKLHAVKKLCVKEWGCTVVDNYQTVMFDNEEAIYTVMKYEKTECPKELQ